MPVTDKTFRKMFEFGVDMINLLNAEGNINYASPATLEVLGYSPSEMLGMGMFDLVHPDDIPGAQQLFQELMTHPGQKYYLELRLKHKNGQWQWMETFATNLLDDPDVGTIVTQGRDITAQVLDREALRKSTAELEQRVRQRTDELQRTVNLMAGRELRIAELKEGIKQLRAQLKNVGIEPIANDPLLDEP